MQKPTDTIVRSEIDFLDKIRVSMGTAIALGLMKGKLDAEPTTAYFMTYYEGKCAANCSFCPQAELARARQNFSQELRGQSIGAKMCLEHSKRQF